MYRIIPTAVAACFLFCAACTADSPKTAGDSKGAATEAVSDRHIPGEEGRAQSGQFGDFNRNGIDDAIDISVGNSLDVDLNGIPDEAE